MEDKVEDGRMWLEEGSLEWWRALIGQEKCVFGVISVLGAAAARRPQRRKRKMEEGGWVD